MISYKTLLKEIEKHVANAKDAKDEQQLREQLSAIRALCDVALIKNNETDELSIIKEQQPQVMTNNSSLSSSKLQENDANGESIFDF